MAIAIWVDGRLRSVGLRRAGPALPGETPGARALRAALMLGPDLAAARSHAGPYRLVWEWPHVYQGARSSADPADLLALAAVGGAVSALAAAYFTPLDVASVEPGQWTGQVPKRKVGNPWESPRGIRIRARLTAEEFAVVPAKHDALDAVGIGLHDLGRFETKRVFPGAT